MERLTDKEINYIALYQRSCDDNHERGRAKWYEMAEKLRHFENLEEEIGCPLEFTSTPYRLSGLRKIWYHKQWCDVVRIVVYEEMTRPYMEVRCKDYKYLKMIFLDDYKNTWWLREDKSE